MTFVFLWFIWSTVKLFMHNWKPVAQYTNMKISHRFWNMLPSLMLGAIIANEVVFLSFMEYVP